MKQEHFPRLAGSEEPGDVGGGGSRSASAAATGGPERGHVAPPALSEHAATSRVTTPIPTLARWRKSSIVLLATLSFLTFCADLAVEWILSFLPSMTVVGDALLDAVALTAVLFPVLYFLSFRPLVRQLELRRRAESELQVANDFLEARVDARTAELQSEVVERRRSESALQASEARYRNLFEHNLAGVYRSTIDGRLLDCNGAFARIYGYESRDEILALPTEVLYPAPETREGFITMLQRHGSLEGVETVGRGKDGSPLWLLESVTLVPDESGGRSVLEGTLFDITQRKRAEEALQRALEAAEARRAEVAGLLEGARAVLEERDFYHAAGTIFESCRALLGATAGLVALVDGTGDELALEFVHIGESRSTLSSRLPVPLRGLLGTACRTGRIVCENNLPEQAPNSEFPVGHIPLDSVLLAPLLIGGRAAGLLGVANKPGGFTPDDVRLATAFAEIAAVALLNSRAEQALRKSRDELEVRVDERTAELKRVNRALEEELRERRRTEELLRRREQTFRSLTENLPDVVSRFDHHFAHLYVSREIEAVAGLDRETYLGKTIRDVGLPPEVAVLWEDNLRSTFESGRVVAFEFSAPDSGGARWFEARLVPELASDGPVETVLAIVRDISEKRRADEALRRSEELLRKVLDLLPVGVWVADERRRLIHGNAAAQRVWGGPQLVGLDQYTARRAWRRDTGVPLQPHEWASARALRLGEASLGQVIEIEASDGTRKVINNSAVPLKDDDGDVRGVIVVNEDITESYRAEEALRKYADEQRALYSVTAAASTLLDAARLLEAVLDAVLPVVGADAGWVTVLHERPDHPPRIAAARGVPASFVETEASRPILECDACRPLLSREGTLSHPHLIDACRRLPREVRASSGLHSHSSVALASGADVLGVLHIGWREPHIFSETDTALLEAIGRQVGIALRNAELFHSEQRARLTAETLLSAGTALTENLELDAVITHLLASLARLIPYDRARVMLRDRHGRLAVRATETPGKGIRIYHEEAPVFTPEANPVIREILAKRSGLVIPDITTHEPWVQKAQPGWERSWMGVPLVAGNTLIGMYSLSKAESDFFSREHLRLAEGLAAPAAMALQNAWLFEEVVLGRSQLQELSRELVKVQENERRAVARELHDEAGQSLSSLMIGLRLLEREVAGSEQILARARELKRIADGVQENLHRLASNLRPASLDHLGLVPALEQLAADCNTQEKPVVQFQAVGVGDQRLAASVETALYRIAQAALTNAIRHARAANVSLLLQDHEDKIVMVVEDDGIGFDLERAERSGRMGLVGMRERAEMLGGRISVESAAGGGTTIFVEVPRE